ncbi:MAG: hypothetical protein ACK50A_02240 [Sphingobacteriaceae bacterium]|jgi:hypothetical protein
MYILKNRKPGEPITLVGHSHGGNVAIEAINYLVTEKLVNPADINLITLNTPDRQEQTLPENSPVDFFSINANGDQIQEIGSNGFDGNGIFPDNFDKQIMFEDQNGGALDFSNHAQSDKNYATFGPMLKQAKRELDASKKPQEYIPPAAQSYQSTPSQPQ